MWKDKRSKDKMALNLAQPLPINSTALCSYYWLRNWTKVWSSYWSSYLVVASSRASSDLLCEEPLDNTPTIDLVTGKSRDRYFCLWVIWHNNLSDSQCYSVDPGCITPWNNKPMHVNQFKGNFVSPLFGLEISQFQYIKESPSRLSFIVVVRENTLFQIIFVTPWEPWT